MDVPAGGEIVAPSREWKISNISPVPGIKDNVGSQSHHPFGRVDIPEKLRTKTERAT